jgi:hypothetical protein
MIVQLCPRRTLPSAFWEDHFQKSLQKPPVIPWDRAREITAAECKQIRTSIQEFQLGEQSEGRNLNHAAHTYATKSGDWAYLAAMKLLIREEQRHAALLGKFMDSVGLPRVRSNWVDSAFRKLRRLAGLEMSICVLLTAEVIAQVYYHALFDATRSHTLRVMCQRILEDEEQHVRFQSERLAILRQRRSQLSANTAVVLQRLLFAGTSLIVWRGHRRVFCAAGLTFWNFWVACQRKMDVAVALMNPRSYEW